MALLIAKSFSVAGFNLNSIPASQDRRRREDAHRPVAQRRAVFPLNGTVSLGEVPDLHRRYENRELMGRSMIRIGGDL